jgi:UDP-N-acetylglucosamine/UDP-N-acetylgalactosamine diphosphorylase
VLREDEFAPTKNAAGSSTHTPEIARKMSLNRDRKWLIQAGCIISDDVEVEISPSLSYNGENLDKFKGRVFEKNEIINN